MTLRCDKVSFRITPTGKKALEWVASYYQDLTVAEFVRRCIDTCLTGQPDYLPGWFKEIAPPDGKDLPPLEQVEEWRKVLD